MADETSPTTVDSDPTFILSPPKILSSDEKDKEISQLKNVIYYDSIEKEKLEKKIKKLKKSLKKMEDSQKDCQEKLKQQTQHLSQLSNSPAISSTNAEKKSNAESNDNSPSLQQQPVASPQVDLKGLLKQFKLEKECEKTKVTLLRSQIEQESKEKFLIDKFILLFYNTEDADELEDKEQGYAKNLKPIFFAFQKWQHQPHFLQNITTAIRYSGLRKPFHFRISLFWIKFVANFIQILTISHEASIKNALQKISSIDNICVQGNPKSIPNCSFPFLMSRFSEANVISISNNNNTPNSNSNSKDSKDTESKPAPVSSFSLVNNFIQNLTNVFSELYTSFLCTLFIKLEKILKKEKDREEKHEVFRYFESLYANLIAWKVDPKFIVHIFTSCIEYVDHLLVYQMAISMRQTITTSSNITHLEAKIPQNPASVINTATNPSSASHPDTIIFTKSVLAFFFSFLKNFWAKMKNDLKLHNQNIPSFFCYSHQACDSWLSYLSLAKQVPGPEVLKVCRAMCKNYSNAQFKALFSFVKEQSNEPTPIATPVTTNEIKEVKEIKETKEKPHPKLTEKQNSKSNLSAAKAEAEKVKQAAAAAALLVVNNPPPPPPPPPQPIVYDPNQFNDLKTFSISLTLADTTVEGDDAFPHLLTTSRQATDKLCKQINIKSNPSEYSMSDAEKAFLSEIDFLFL